MKKRENPTYRSWYAMIRRCKDYPRYAGKISVCDRWKTFENFLLDMGERPKGKSIDRYPNPKGNYEPSNCRWATHAEQMQNRTDSVPITWENETTCVSEWCRKLNLNRHKIASRVRIGWTYLEALGLMERPARRTITNNETVEFQGVKHSLTEWLEQFDKKQTEARTEWAIHGYLE